MSSKPMRISKNFHGKSVEYDSFELSPKNEEVFQQNYHSYLHPRPAPKPTCRKMPEILKIQQTKKNIQSFLRFEEKAPLTSNCIKSNGKCHFAISSTQCLKKIIFVSFYIQIYFSPNIVRMREMWGRIILHSPAQFFGKCRKGKGPELHLDSCFLFLENRNIFFIIFGAYFLFLFSLQL